MALQLIICITEEEYLRLNSPQKVRSQGYLYEFYRIDEENKYCFKRVIPFGFGLGTGVGTGTGAGGGGGIIPTPTPECCLEADQNGALFANQNDLECLQPDQGCSI